MCKGNGEDGKKGAAIENSSQWAAWAALIQPAHKDAFQEAVEKLNKAETLWMGGGDKNTALQYYLDAYDFAIFAENRPMQASICMGLGYALLEVGRADEAIEKFSFARDFARRCGNSKQAQIAEMFLSTAENIVNEASRGHRSCPSKSRVAVKVPVAKDPRAAQRDADRNMEELLQLEEDEKHAQAQAKRKSKQKSKPQKKTEAKRKDNRQELACVQKEMQQLVTEGEQQLQDASEKLDVHESEQDEEVVESVLLHPCNQEMCLQSENPPSTDALRDGWHEAPKRKNKLKKKAMQHSEAEATGHVQPMESLVITSQEQEPVQLTHELLLQHGLMTPDVQREAVECEAVRLPSMEVSDVALTRKSAEIDESCDFLDEALTDSTFSGAPSLLPDTRSRSCSSHSPHAGNSVSSHPSSSDSPRSSTSSAVGGEAGVKSAQSQSNPLDIAGLQNLLDSLQISIAAPPGLEPPPGLPMPVCSLELKVNVGSSTCVMKSTPHEAV